jgi:hypothetical protein
MERTTDHSTRGKSNVPVYVLSLVGLAVYAGGTYVVVDQAGGVGVHSEDSNTPNGVMPGPPAFPH